MNYTIYDTLTSKSNITAFIKDSEDRKYRVILVDAEISDIKALRTAPSSHWASAGPNQKIEVKNFVYDNFMNIIKVAYDDIKDVRKSLSRQKKLAEKKLEMFEHNRLMDARNTAFARWAADAEALGYTVEELLAATKMKVSVKLSKADFDQNRVYINDETGESWSADRRGRPPKWAFDILEAERNSDVPEGEAENAKEMVNVD